MHFLAAIAFLGFILGGGLAVALKLMFPHPIDFTDPDRFGHWRRSA